MADLSQTGWTAATLGGTTSPYAAVNTADLLKTAPVKLNDPSLGSRQYANPLAGNRQAAAVGSVYQQTNVPAFLTQAVNDLNTEQARKRLMLSDWQSRLLDLYSSDPANQYLLAPSLAALSVQPGATFQTAGDAQFQNPLVGQGYAREASATAAAKSAITGEARRNQSAIRRIQDQLVSTPGGEKRYQLQNELLRARSNVSATRPGLAAAATSGWFSSPAVGTWRF